MTGELQRKALHVGMGGFALLLRWLTPWQAMACAAAALAFNLFLLRRLTGDRFLREGERASGLPLGIVLYPAAVLGLLLVFHRRLELAAGAWGLLAVGDGMATVAGITLRGPKLPWNRQKSWSGSLAFVLWGTAAAAFLIRWVQRGALGGNGGSLGDSFLRADGLPLLPACLLAATAAALAESLRSGIDDNLLVPFVGGGALAALTLVSPEVAAGHLEAHRGDLAVGLAVNVALAFLAYLARGVTFSGAVWGTLLGSLLYALAGWRGFLLLLAFFVLGTLVTKLGYAHKAALGIAQERGGRRGARHAFANVGAGVLFAALAVSTTAPGLFTLALVAAFATALSDTTGSEIGQAYGRTPYLVTTFRRVPAGTDGAVSLEGTLAGMAASAVVAGIAWSVGLVSMTGAAIVVVAALVGTTLESYLGAASAGAEAPDNEAVNFLNTLAGGLAAIGLASL
ncbi:MAG TPA: DUF92 domain-containing protein [Candidatus Polarisedimenticolaceae bacterium]|nr:DUF92 domain-containing protein [Candidatus Polarisedimenticolaceae bacterium]